MGNREKNRTLYIYKISQDTNWGYDTFDSAVVVASSEQEAKEIHPNGYDEEFDLGSWDEAKDIKVEFIGTADKRLKDRTVICASFNAG